MAFAVKTQTSVCGGAYALMLAMFVAGMLSCHWWWYLWACYCVIGGSGVCTASCIEKNVGYKQVALVYYLARETL